MCDEQQLQQITREVSNGVRIILGDKLRKIILFGSYARGDYDSESDIDIMVLADVSAEEKSTLEKAIDKVSSAVSLENDITVFISLKDKRFFDAHLNILPFYRNVEREGIEIYGEH